MYLQLIYKTHSPIIYPPDVVLRRSLWKASRMQKFCVAAKRAARVISNQTYGLRTTYSRLPLDAAPAKMSTL